jgi:aspartate aminotransferase
MSLSLIGKSISASATLKLNETAAILKAKGEPIIHLGGGEPKSKAPLDAILAAVALINSGEVRYTPADGVPALKQAIIRYTEDFYGRRVTPQNVIASSGAKQAIMVALQAIVNPQEEVVVRRRPGPGSSGGRLLLPDPSGYRTGRHVVHKSHNHQQPQ